MELIRIAKDTCDELSSVPYCDGAKLSSLAGRYSALVPQVHDTLRQHVGHLQELEPPKHSDYALLTEVDITRAASRILNSEHSPAR